MQKICSDIVQMSEVKVNDSYPPPLYFCMQPMSLEHGTFPTRDPYRILLATTTFNGLRRINDHPSSNKIPQYQHIPPPVYFCTDEFVDLPMIQSLACQPPPIGPLFSCIALPVLIHLAPCTLCSRMLFHNRDNSPDNPPSLL